MPPNFKTHDETGLPRPLAHDPRGTMRPVPWTQGQKPWGDVTSFRMARARTQCLCLVCGEHVEAGAVLWDDSSLTLTAKPSRGYVLGEDLRGEYGAVYPIADGGCLHTRCAKITRAHCRTIRDKFTAGTMVEFPFYCDPMAALAASLDRDSQAADTGP